MGGFRQNREIVRPFFIGCAFGVFLSLAAIFFGGGLTAMYALAANATLQPNANGTTTQGTLTTCGAGGFYDCLNDGVTDPSVPVTTGDYITQTNGQIGFAQLDNSVTNAATVSSVTVHVYHLEGSTNMQTSVALFDSDETTQYGVTTGLTNRTTASWDTATFSGLSLTQSQLTRLEMQVQCSRPGGGKATGCTDYAAYAVITYTPVTDVTASSTGAFQDVFASTTNDYLGGAFVLTDNTGPLNVTSVKIQQVGTADGLTNLSNIRLYYKMASTCSTASYTGTEPLYGSATTSFSAAQGYATFNATVAMATTSQMCLYPVLDVGPNVVYGNTIKLQITNPSTDITETGSGLVTPTSSVSMTGTSTIRDIDRSQIHYHWRNDDGGEATATAAFAEDIGFSNMSRNKTERLRIEVTDAGNATTTSDQYRLEYAQNPSTCALASGWTTVGSAGAEWLMATSSYITDGNTTNIAVAAGGTTDANTTFVGTGMLRVSTSTTAAVTLSPTQFTEMEFAIKASTSAPVGQAYCFRVTRQGTSLETYSQYPTASIAADLYVAALGSQNTPVNVGTANQYLGGLFAVSDQSVGAKTLTSFQVHASGTVDLQNNISNVALYYQYDTTNYDCSTSTFAGGNNVQYGATSTAGFTSSSTLTFTGSATITQTQAACFFVVYSVSSNASDGQTFEVYLNDPGGDDIVANSTVSPSSKVDIGGYTTFASPNATQAHYHWRDNNGTEVTASSAAAEDAEYTKVPLQTVVRLRLGIYNSGGATSTSNQFRLEWGRRVSSCSQITSWHNIGTAGGDWLMAASQLVDGADTTNIATSTGGVDDLGTFLTPNGGQNSSSGQTASLNLPSHYQAELEYSLEASSSAIQGATYCFRVTNAGVPLQTYTNYAKATVKLATDFHVIHGVSDITGTSTTLVNGVDYQLQKNIASRAFIRITDTANTGSGPNAGTTGNNNSNDVTAYVLNPSNIVTSVTIARPGTANDTRVAWEIIEYTGPTGGDNEFVVRSASTIAYGTTALGATTTAVTGVVNDAQVVPFITGQGNPDTGRFNYNTGLSTSKWNSGVHTATFERGSQATNAVIVSYAVVEFTGANWQIQRVSHTYSSLGVVETAAITPVNSLSHAFIQAQNRVGSGLSTHAEFGHEVWLSGIGTVSFRLDGNATTPSGHTSVAWVIENTQTSGTTMNVQRYSGTLPATAGLTVTTVNLTTPLTDYTTASLNINNRDDGTGKQFPQPIVSADLLSTTQFEIQASDNADNINYRAEVVEWPTASSKLAQSTYRFYQDNWALTPTSSWAGLGENAAITASDTPLKKGDAIRIRMNLSVSAAALPAGVDAFKLQYAPEATSCAAISNWADLGGPASTTVLWRGTNSTTTAGTPLTTLVLSNSTIDGTYENSSSTAFTPYTAQVNDVIEYDWNVTDYAATDKTNYCFRMVNSDGSNLNSYATYPTLITAGYGPVETDWRFYDDENDLTPTTSMAATNTAPSAVPNTDIIKLRTVIAEQSGAAGQHVKFKVQYSDNYNFSTGTVHDVVATSSCTASSIWCYANGAGTDNATITAAVLASADSCVAGVGPGCGTYNEGTATSTAALNQQAYAKTEFEFTLRNAGARVNTIYYFRLWDEVNNAVVPTSSPASYPSVVSEPASMTFTVRGLPNGTTTAGIVTNASTSAIGVGFGAVPINTEYFGAQRISINTNATEGYKLYVYNDQPLTNSYGTTIPYVTGTNASPLGWATGCANPTTGCFGYHTTDSVLSGGSVRFGANDTYAAPSTTPAEIMYSPVPINDTHDMVYALQVGDQQPAGDYTDNITYIAVPVF